MSSKLNFVCNYIFILLTFFNNFKSLLLNRKIRMHPNPFHKLLSEKIAHFFLFVFIIVFNFDKTVVLILHRTF